MRISDWSSDVCSSDLSAGNETVTAWISHTLRLMLTDPRFAARLHGGRLGVDDALDAALWRDPPMNNMPARYALRDPELGGRPKNGRAACREWVCQVVSMSGAAASFIKKQHNII